MAIAAGTARTTPSPASSPQASQQQIEFIHRSAWKAGVLGALNVAARVLAARMIVLIAVSGGIFLAYRVVGQPDWLHVAILSVYAIGVVGPSIVLAVIGK